LLEHVADQGEVFAQLQMDLGLKVSVKGSLGSPLSIIWPEMGQKHLRKVFLPLKSMMLCFMQHLYGDHPVNPGPGSHIRQPFWLIMQ